MMKFSRFVQAGKLTAASDVPHAHSRAHERLQCERVRVEAEREFKRGCGSSRVTCSAAYDGGPAARGADSDVHGMILVRRIEVEIRRLPHNTTCDPWLRLTGAKG